MRRSPLLAVVLTVVVMSACGGSSANTTAAPTTTAAAATAPTTATATTTVAAAATTTAAATPTTSASPRATSLADAPGVLAADGGFSAAQAGCIVDKLVATVGDTRALSLADDQREFSALGVDDKKAVTDSVVTCVPKDQYAALIATNLQHDLKDAGITTEQATCLGTGLVDVVTVETLLGIGGEGFNFDSIDPDAQAKFINVFTTCLPPEVLGKLANLA